MRLRNDAVLGGTLEKKMIAEGCNPYGNRGKI